MHIDERIKAFSLLGEKIDSIDNETLNDLIANTRQENPWFTAESIKMSLTGIRKFLHSDVLHHWLSNYTISDSSNPKTIALVLAGNIPLVGFHDILTTLISGNNLQLKLSSKDSVLTQFILTLLIALEPRFKERIMIVNKLGGFDGVIATGSDNSARYFEYYFGKYPSIIRKNRTSCAIITGEEQSDDLQNLGIDIFSYFGLGCRNVSKLYLPQDYPLTSLFDHWSSFSEIIHHHKYANNYDYQKAILMINKTDFYDNGFVLLTPSDKTVSPISVLYYEAYQSPAKLEEKLNLNAEKIQCIIGKNHPATVSFGESQFPEPDDYADQVDTLKFLIDFSMA